jgi:nitroreductase
MSFIELAKARYSVRSFSDRKVEPHVLEQILEAARVAPTACNNQPWKILVIRDEKALAKLKDCTRYTFGAPLALLVCSDHEKEWKRSFDGQTSGEVDASIVGTHLMLAAADLGLGTTWVGSFDPAKIREIYNIPTNLEPVCLFPLGYPADDCKPSTGHTERVPLSDLIVYDHF